MGRLKTLRLYWGMLKPGYKVALCALLAILIFAGFYFAGTAGDTISSFISNKRDQRHERAIDTSQEKASESEGNANVINGQRELKEEDARRAEGQREQARENSNRTVAPTRAARRRYEETRRNNASDPVPALPDERICTELESRGIPCPR
jgi:hypothetical protein